MTNKRTIGTSSLEVFPLNFGGNVFGWTADEPTSFAVLDDFVAAGGNFIDTADSYSAWAPGNSGGESEVIIGKWRTHNPGADVLVATKVSRHPEFRGLMPDNVRAALQASLERLQTDAVDVYYAHYDDPDVPMNEIAHVFSELKDAGRIREIGISNFTADRIREWFATARANGYHLPVAFQPGYHLLDRAYENELRAVAEEEQLGVFPYYSLAAGFLTGKYQRGSSLDVDRSRMITGYANEHGFTVIDVMGEIAAELGTHHTAVALAWLLAQPTITAPIASARNQKQLTDILDFTTVELSPEHLARLDQVSRS